ncbi:hypothetical protein D3C85_1022590 [compost metagenome]
MVVPGFVEDGETEFPTLRQHDGKQQAVIAGQAQKARKAIQDQGLDQQQGTHAGKDEHPVMGHHAQVDGHADGHEEQAQQQALERFDRLFQVIPVAGLRHQHAHQESAQACRQARIVEQLGCAHHHQQRGRGKEFIQFRLGRPPQQPQPVGQAHDSHGQERLLEGRRRRAVRPQQAGRHQHGNRGHVLEQQHPQGGAPQRRASQSAFVEQPQRHGRGR